MSEKEVYVFKPSFAQERLWVLDQMGVQDATYNLGHSLRLEGDLNTEAMQRALQEIVDRHEILSTTFGMVNGEPVQLVHPATRLTLPVQDVAAAELEELVRAEARQPFDLARGPLLRVRLFRVSPKDHTLLVVMHHIISDGWSMDVCMQELVALYAAFSAGKPSPLPELELQYGDFAEWQREWMAGDELNKQVGFWKESLKGAPHQIDLPTDRPRQAVQTFYGANFAFRLDPDLTRGIEALARANDATPFMALLAAFGILTGHYSNSSDVLIGSPIANRNRGEVEPLIGFFVNTLVMRVDCRQREMSFRQAVARVKEMALGAFAHQDIPFEKLVEEIQPQRDMSMTPLFQVFFAMQNLGVATRGTSLELPGLKVHPTELETDTAKFDLALALSRGDDFMAATFEYNTDLFDQSTIAAMADRFCVLLKKVIASPDSPLSSLSLLADSEKQALLTRHGQVKQFPQADKPIHLLFEEQAALTPEALALTAGDQSLTYAELNSRANQLAHQLLEAGAGPEVPVGLAMTRGIEQLIAVLATLKTGSCYVPLEPEYPDDRLAYIFSDSGCQILVTNLPDRAGAIWRTSTILYFTDFRALTGENLNLEPSLHADHTAYVMYTSGSTGKPKGIRVPHRAIANRLLWAQDTWPQGPTDVFLQLASFSFDISIWEIFAPLMSGGRLVLIPQGAQKDPQVILNTILQQGVTAIHFVPSLLTAFLAESEVVSITSLKQVFCGGEGLPLSLMKRFFSLMNAELHHFYGPTEAAINMTAQTCSRDAALVCIGTPIANTRAYVVQPGNKLAPVGLPGELYIGGTCLAMGYQNQPRQTALSFVPDAFSGVAGARLYRTGDLVRHLPGEFEENGQARPLHFLGRVDFQIKIRGFRIEPGEIETLLLDHPEVAATVVVPKSLGGELHLVAYIQPAGDNTTVASLRSWLADRVPDYMVPSSFVVLGQIPLNANGKVDRQALPDPDAVVGRTVYIGPTNPTEEILIQLWERILGKKRIGINDSFFELGGHSLLATKVLARIRKIFDVEMPIRALFEAPTISALARKIDEKRQSEAGSSVPGLEHASRDLPIPLSSSQQRFWFLGQLNPDKNTFNILTPTRIHGPLNIGLLEKALNIISQRHEILRTVFFDQDGTPYQQVLDHRPVFIPVFDLTQSPNPMADVAEFLRQENDRPFNMEKGPLWRITAMKLGEDEHIVTLNMDHIVADEWSSEIMMGEAFTLYRGFVEGRPVSLPEMEWQYRDFAFWQQNWVRNGGLAQQFDYWEKTLSRTPPILDLPTDYKRPMVQEFEGANVTFTLPPDLTRKLEDFSLAEGHTLFITLLSVFAVVLHRASGQDDMVVGIPAANRRHAEVQNLIGFFLNVLPIRMDLSAEPGYRQFIQKVKNQVVEAFDHQDAPFEEIIKHLELKPDMSRPALRQTAFILQTPLSEALEIPELRAESIEVDRGVSRIDMLIAMMKKPEGLVGNLEFNTNLFKRETMERFGRFFVQIAEDLVNHPDNQFMKLPPLVENPTGLPAPKKAEVSRKVRPWKHADLVENQLLFWFARKLNPGVQLYFDRAITAFRIFGPINRQHFQKAFYKLIEGSDVLRMTIHDVKGLPETRIHEEFPYFLQHVDLTSFSDPEATYKRWVADQVEEHMFYDRKLFHAALVRLAEDRYVFYFDVGHIIFDGSSIGVVVNNLTRLYQQSLAGEMPDQFQLPGYNLFTDGMKAFKESKAHEVAAAYWAEKLADKIKHSTYYSRKPAIRSTASVRELYTLTEDETLRLKELAKEEGLFSQAVFFAALLYAWAFRATGTRKQRVGTPFANRTFAIRDVLGLCMNACPIQIEIGPGDTFRELARRVQVETLETARYQQYPIRNPPNAKVYDLYFNYQNVSFTRLCDQTVEFELIHTGHSNITFTLQVQDFNASGRPTLEFDINREAFSPEQRQAAVDQYVTLMRSYLAEPNALIDRAEYLGPKERNLLDSRNHNVATYPTEVTLHGLFEAQVARTPEATALVFGEDSMTYAELNRRSNQLARWLGANGIGRDDIVGVCMMRSFEMVIALFGILKAGGTYLPLDPTYPVDRLGFMLEDAKTRVLLLQERMLAGLPELDERLRPAALDGMGRELATFDSSNLELELHPKTGAYLIYTSGSTGRPKGVRVAHEAIANRLFWMQDEYGLTGQDAVLQKTTYAFDVSVWEFFWPMMTGARLVVAEPEKHGDPAYLKQIIEQQNITTMHFVPGMLQHFLAEDAGYEGLGCVKRVICSGEALPPSLEKRFFQCLPHSQLHNLYGPTEAAVDVTYWACSADSQLHTVPIGRPIANTRIHLLDNSLNPAPPGMHGELFIAGINLARGYHQRPGLTAERFLPDPYSPTPGGRMYRTSDEVRDLLLKDGLSIEFLGRVDNQVKLRGFRIEPGEIETALMEQDPIREAVVLLRKDERGDDALIAYMTLRHPETEPEARDLRGGLRGRLPEYMIPSGFIILDQFPLTPNGKADRKALAEQQGRLLSRGGAMAGPDTPLQALILDIFKQLLNLEEISIHDNFFDLGGHSLLATRFISRLHESLPVNISLQRFFEIPTVAQLAEDVEAQQQSARADQDGELEQLIADVENMSDEELEALLDD